MNAILAAILLALVPIGDDIRTAERVDMLERNHAWQADNAGCRLSFVQFIFWDWCDVLNRWVVVDWRWCVQPGSVLAHANAIDWQRRELTYVDADCVRRIRFNVYRETAGNFDHEVERTKVMARHLRRGLARVQVP